MNNIKKANDTEARKNTEQFIKNSGMEMKEETKRNIQHELNEALRNSLEIMKVKVKNIEGCKELDQDYYILLESFENHLKMVERVNKGLK